MPTKLSGDEQIKPLPKIIQQRKEQPKMAKKRAPRSRVLSQDPGSSTEEEFVELKAIESKRRPIIHATHQKSFMFHIIRYPLLVGFKQPLVLFV